MSVSVRYAAQPVRRAQKGAALFVSLMILILLSLLAISASQVTALQEKMVQSYWADVRAFEGAEQRLRARERQIRERARVEECPVLEDAGTPPDWAFANAQPAAAANHSQVVGTGEAGRGSGMEQSLGAGGRTNVECQFFMISASESDARVDSQAKSWAVVQAIYVP
jgi:type IV pilus assembly protein PilX